MTRQWAETEPFDLPRAWQVLLELGRRAQSGKPVDAEGGEALFGAPHAVAPEVKTLLDLYLPLCLGPAASELVVAHLGQSLDGQIATASGDSRYVTSEPNLVHVHRLRALCHAVVVGAGTVERDDPQLTTRLVLGANPARVVLDPRLRTMSARLWSDQAARSLVICESGRATARRLPSTVEVVELPLSDGRISPASIVQALRERGLSRLLVEGGGLTVSHFLEARALQRLHVCVSPVLLGRGRPGLVLPAIDRLAQALRPRTRRFELGEDVLFDCELAVPAD